MITDAFHPHDPETAQDNMKVEDFAQLLSKLKPAFIHHPKSKEMIKGILAEIGCNWAHTYFDVPRLRTSTYDGYLTSGISYAFHPHRDTWYSAPTNQINFWIPIYGVEAENIMAFHPYYWNHPLKNGSRDYNYFDWNKTSRKEASKHIKSDTRKQPKPEEEALNLEPEVRVVTRPGGILIFSGAQLHSTIPNTTRKTRFSIDFRTVHIEDVKNKIGAHNIDSECTGTTLRDYLRCTDLARIPEELVYMYDPNAPELDPAAEPAESSH
jgi:ectoine hydroxylase-related dioxygenase (phytanoyl-CoA dioxygenase family)